MVGTVFNAVTVAIGASAGLVLGKRLSEGLHAIIFQALGLFTLGIGVAMSLEVANLFAVFLSLIAGVVAGHALQLDQRMKTATARLGEGTGTALVQAVLLFCLGAMTLIGCMQDGLKGDATVLFIKGSMDLVSPFPRSSVGAWRVVGCSSPPAHPRRPDGGLCPVGRRVV